MCLGRTNKRITELELNLLRQQREISKLRELVYDRTRICYGPEKPLLVEKAIGKICKHLGIAFIYAQPDKTQIGWTVVDVKDDPEE